ncbi:transcriptional regulator [Pseudomonas aeruginosa]|nr:transcriptional regulator [Pseudomonas aeruginosa]
MKLSQLGFFCAVVERGTIAAAAEQLHCVPSNITTRLRELEGQLGVALFNRERNRLLVTPEGRLLYRHARRPAGAGRRDRRAVRRRPGARRATGRRAWTWPWPITCPSAWPATAASRRALNCTSARSISLLLERLLMEGELDLIRHRRPHRNTRCWPARLAFRERLLRVTPADLPAPTPEDLAGLELYVFRPHLPLPPPGRPAGWRRAVSSRVRTLEIESYPSLFACIEAGLGFACVPESFVARMPSTRRGFHAEPVAGLDSSDIHFVWRQTASLAADPGLHRQHRRRLTPTNDAATQTHSEKSVTAEPLHRPEKKPPPTRPGGDTGSTLGGRLPSRSPPCPLGFSDERP